MDADSYKCLKSHTTELIDKLTIQMSDLEIADKAFEKYARYGISLLKDLTWYFQDENYQASALNPALALVISENIKTCKMKKLET